MCSSIDWRRRESNGSGPNHPSQVFEEVLERRSLNQPGSRRAVGSFLVVPSLVADMVEVLGHSQNEHVFEVG